MKPKFHLRRIYLLWLPLLVVGGLSFYLIAPYQQHSWLWALIPITIGAWAITAELTEHKETT